MLLERGTFISRRCATILLLVVGVGCAGQLGPKTVALTRTDYNIAAQETSAQELLLNLVRLRYRDTPYFLQIASLSTNMRAKAGIGGVGTFPSSGTRVGEVAGTISIEESPTITYTPLVGDHFVSQLLEPVDPSILLLLSHAGWSMERFMRLFVQEIGGIPNAPTASGPTPTREPAYAEFLRVASLFRILQSRREVMLTGGSLSGGADSSLVQGGNGILLRFTAGALESEEYRELQRALGLEPGRQIFELVSGVGSAAPQRINVVLRSVLSALFYASHAIRVPEEHRLSGYVTQTVTENGDDFDWERVTGSLLRVSNGKAERTPYVSVRYRGHSFYIDDGDLSSKSTFSMLNLVLALQAGEIPSGAPILTLPVSQ